jgi:hypothetical protein
MMLQGIVEYDKNYIYNIYLNILIFQNLNSYLRLGGGCNAVTVVGWGITLQAGRSPARVPDIVEFFQFT